MKTILSKVSLNVIAVALTSLLSLNAYAADLNNSIGLLKAIGSCQDGFSMIMENKWLDIESVTESAEKSKTMRIDGKQRKTKVITYKLVTQEPSVYDFLSGRRYNAKKVATLTIEKISYEEDPELTAGCDSSSCFEDIVTYKCKIKNH